MLVFIFILAVFLIAFGVMLLTLRSIWFDHLTRRQFARRKINLNTLARIETLLANIDALDESILTNEGSCVHFLELYESTIRKADILLQMALELSKNQGSFDELSVYIQPPLLACERKLLDLVNFDKSHSECAFNTRLPSQGRSIQIFEMESLVKRIQSFEYRVDGFHRNFYLASR